MVLEKWLQWFRSFHKDPRWVPSTHIRWLTAACNSNSRGIWSLLTPHTTSHRFKNNKNKSKNKFLVFDRSDFHWKLENYGYYILRFCNLFKCSSLAGYSGRIPELALGRLREEDSEFDTRLYYVKYTLSQKENWINPSSMLHHSCFSMGRKAAVLLPHG